MKILCEQEILKLIKGAKEGQEKSLEDLIEYYTPYILSKCSKYNINGFDFEDLVGECNGILLKCIETFIPGEAAFTNYFFKALSNSFNYMLRKSYTSEALGNKIYSSEERMCDEDFGDIIWEEEIKAGIKAYMEKLSGVEKVIMEEIYYKGKTMSQIARSLKFPFHKVQHIRNLEIKRMRNSLIYES